MTYFSDASVQISNSTPAQAIADNAEMRRAVAMEGLSIAAFISGLPPKSRAKLSAAKSSIEGTFNGYLRWEDRRDGHAKPRGWCDKQGRWYPTDDENSDGFTDYIRSPSIRWRWNYYKAGFALGHCLALDDGDENTLRVLKRVQHDVRLWDLMLREPETAVAQVLAALATPVAKPVKWWMRKAPGRCRKM